jgi:hypothetical protein
VLGDLRVFDRERGVGGKTALGVAVSDDQEVQPDRNVRVGARLEILGARGGAE